MRKTGGRTTGNTPERECTECWWVNTIQWGIMPEHQGENLTREQARQLWDHETTLEEIRESEA